MHIIKFYNLADHRTRNSPILGVSSNKLTSLPQSFGKLTKLWDIFIVDNQFTSIPQCIINLPNLINLIFDDNKITSLPENIGNLHRLEHLGLGDNQLTSLPESIGDLVHLRQFWLGHNQLQNLPQSFKRLTLLEGSDINITLEHPNVEVNDTLTSEESNDIDIFLNNNFFGND